MRKLFAIIVIVVLSVPVFAANHSSDREQRVTPREWFVVKIVKKLLRGVTTNSDGATVPIP